MKIAIVDAGSTKIDWIIHDSSDDTTQQFRSLGFNPHHSDATFEMDIALKEAINSCSQIHYYGTGINSIVFQNQIKTLLEKVSQAQTILVESDLLGTCRALFKENDGIACILGTGSNSCVFRGDKITEQIDNLGYLLADEGSGADIGRRLLSSYFNESMPQHLRDNMQEQFDLNKEEVLKSLYKKELPSRYMASFAVFATTKDEWIYRLLDASFEEFIQRRIQVYKDSENLQVGFTGSIAFIHQKRIDNILLKYGLKEGIYLKRPIQQLLNYHIG